MQNAETIMSPILTTRAGKYLGFRLDEEEYGIGLLRVQEIIGLMKITQVPYAPASFRGVINLRGRIIPVLDLRRKFNLTFKADTEKTCIIVVCVESHGVKATMGVVVDHVSEVMDVKREQLEDPPEFGASIRNTFILAMGKVGTRVVMLLDIDKVLNDHELGNAVNAAENGN